MSITKEVKDQLEACGFKYQGITRVVDNPYLRFDFYYNCQYWGISIPDHPDVTVQWAIQILMERVKDIYLDKGVAQGKKEVGEYLKTLISE